MSSSNFKIRWSPHSTDSDRRFLLINARESEIAWFRVNAIHQKRITYDQEGRQSKIAYIRCFDWSPKDKNRIAVGQSSGEAVVLQLREGFDTSGRIPLAVKHQRACNSVSFNSENLLAAGLDKVRNDFCLNIWDLTRSPAPNSGALQPARQLAASEAVSSVRFFEDEPNNLVAGVGYKWMRLYDLREATPAQSVPTRCVHGVFIDQSRNYFASYSDEGAVAVWDRRFMKAAQEAVLHFDRIGNVEDKGLTSLRFSPTREGLLGLLTNQGGVRIFELGKILGGENAEMLRDHYRDDKVRIGGAESGMVDQNPDMLFLKRAHDIVKPVANTGRNSKHEQPRKIVTFDWISTGGVDTRNPQLLCYRQSGDFEVYTLPGDPISIDINCNNTLAFSSSSSTDLKFVEPRVSLKMEILSKYFRRPSELEVPQSTLAVGSMESGAGGSFPGANMPSPQRRRTGSILWSDYKFDPRDTLGNDITVTMKRRAEKGYAVKDAPGFSLKDDPDLEDMWQWLRGAEESTCNNGMISGWYDLSYLGVYSIWTGYLGSNEDSRLPKGQFRRPEQRLRELALSCSEINTRNERDEFHGLITNHHAQRRLALAMCGWDFPYKQLEPRLQDMEKKEQFAKAAGWALFHNDLDRCIAALMKGGQEMKLISTAVAGYTAHRRGRGRDEDDSGLTVWKELCRNMAVELEDPYLRAIFAFVANGDWKDVLDEYGLPIKEKLGIALRFLKDDDLNNYINGLMAEAIRDGNLTGILLTGLTNKAIDLLQNYVNRTGDVQSAALVSSFVVPRYFRDSRVTRWIDSYRALLNKWKLYTIRAHFDVARGDFARAQSLHPNNPAMRSRPPSDVPRRQIYLRCLSCDRDIVPNALLAKAEQSSRAALSSLTRSASTMSASINPLLSGPAPAASAPPASSPNKPFLLCPHCNNTLPRCAVCQALLGAQEYPVISVGTTGRMRVTGEMTAKFNNWFSFCVKCAHGTHVKCAERWWEEERMCMVAGCACVCKEER